MTAKNGQTSLKGRVFIATGASGGHIFPGLGIAEALRKEGYGCTFIGAGRQFTALVEEKGFDFITLPASQFNVRGVRAKLVSLMRMVKAVFVALRVIHQQKPVAVLGMGSYASVAALFAAWLLRVPTLVHEQNAKPGRANLLLSRFAGRVMLTFDGAKAFFKGARRWSSKFITVGSPVRSEVLEFRGLARPKSEALRLLVLGGSQGSTVMAELVPAAIALLPATLRKKLSVVQQARKEDIPHVKEIYETLDLKELVIESFFSDLPKRLHEADLVVTRAGTSSLLELAVLGRAAIIIPHELADGHQIENARILSQVGGALMLREKGLTADHLAKELKNLLMREGRRRLLEENVALLAKPHAAQEAAAEVIRFSQGV